MESCRMVMYVGLSERSILELSNAPMHGFIADISPEIFQFVIGMFPELR